MWARVWLIKSARSRRSDFSMAPDFRARARAFGLAGMATAETSRSSCARYFLRYGVSLVPFSHATGMKPTLTADRNFPLYRPYAIFAMGLTSVAKIAYGLYK